MKNLLLAFVMVLIASACGKKTQTVTEYVSTPGETVYVQPPTESQQDQIDEITEAENDYRDSLGQLPLSEGLTCTVHNSSNANLNASFGSAAYTFSLHGGFNQEQIDSTQASEILPESIRNLYIGLNYSLRCQGYIVLLESGVHEFTLNSDDGSRLYVNGTLVVDNNGSHAMLVKSGSISLRRGVYSFRLDYSQSGGGDQGLILSSGGDVLDAAFLYR